MAADQRFRQLGAEPARLPAGERPLQGGGAGHRAATEPRPMKAEIRPATESDIDVILADIRPADVAEMTALGTTPERAMRQGLARSDWTATGLLDGVPVCMFGVAPVNLMLGRGADRKSTRLNSSP